MGADAASENAVSEVLGFFALPGVADIIVDIIVISKKESVVV